MLSFLIVFILYTSGHAFGWFTFNSQLVWDYWKEKSLLACIVFAASYVIFPVLTWWFLNESMLTTKTLICIMLSLVIVFIQAFWRTSG